MADQRATSSNERRDVVALLDNSDRVRNRLALMQWIENARSLLNELNASAAGDAALRDRLKAHDLGHYVPWQGEESAGMVDLITDVGSHVDATVKYLAESMKAATGEGGAA